MKLNVLDRIRKSQIRKKNLLAAQKAIINHKSCCFCAIG